MRLFQLIGEEGYILGLFNCTVPSSLMSDESVEKVLKSEIVSDTILGINDNDDELDDYLDKNNLERVFVNEVYTD